jgi:hypothetical protein
MNNACVAERDGGERMKTHPLRLLVHQLQAFILPTPTLLVDMELA